MKCPVCHKTRDNKDVRSAAKKLAQKHGIIGEMCNPGGRELRFPFGTIQLSDMCDNCDFETLKKKFEFMKMAEEKEAEE